MVTRAKYFYYLTTWRPVVHIRLMPVGLEQQEAVREKRNSEDEAMIGENWTNEERLRLRAMTIDPVRSSPKRLKELIDYFRTPPASLWEITEGRGLLHVSKSLGTKIRDYVGDGDLDWLDETPQQSVVRFNSEWRGWLLSHSADFSEAVSAYRGELDHQIQSSEIHLGLRASCMRQKVAYGPSHQPFIESIFRRDSELVEIRRRFELALTKGDIDKAKELGNQVKVELVRRIAVYSRWDWTSDARLLRVAGTQSLFRLLPNCGIC